MIQQMFEYYLGLQKVTPSEVFPDSPISYTITLISHTITPSRTRLLHLVRDYSISHTITPISYTITPISHTISRSVGMGFLL